MPETLESLEAKRTRLYHELVAPGDFRRGTISCGRNASDVSTFHHINGIHDQVRSDL